MGPRTRNRRSGQACVEMAVAIVLLVPMLLCLYDFACALRANNSISNMSREGANMASRALSGLVNRRQDIMDAIAITAQPLDMRANGMIYISQLQGDRIVSQDGWQHGDLRFVISSRIGTPSPSDPSPKATGIDVVLDPAQTAYVVEVFYNYQSLFSSSSMLLGRQLYSRTVF